MYNLNYIEIINKSHMLSEIINFLVKEMKLNRGHFEKKYSSFDNEIKTLINSKLLKMIEVSRSIKSGNTDVDFNAYFYEDGDEPTNEFLQAMFDCFKLWQKFEGARLKKGLYEHTNRSASYWFPLVIIEEQINECSKDEEFITVYRGCSQSQFDSNVYKKRQPWTTNFAVAKEFAFHHRVCKLNCVS